MTSKPLYGCFLTLLQVSLKVLINLFIRAVLDTYVLPHKWLQFCCCIFTFT